jgi:hypothetical protein
MITFLWGNSVTHHISLLWTKVIAYSKTVAEKSLMILSKTSGCK